MRIYSSKTSEKLAKLSELKSSQSEINKAKRALNRKINEVKKRIDAEFKEEAAILHTDSLLKVKNEKYGFVLRFSSTYGVRWYVDVDADSIKSHIFKEDNIIECGDIFITIGNILNKIYNNSFEDEILELNTLDDEYKQLQSDALYFKSGISALELEKFVGRDIWVEANIKHLTNYSVPQHAFIKIKDIKSDNKVAISWKFAHTNRDGTIYISGYGRDDGLTDAYNISLVQPINTLTDEEMNELINL